MLIVLADFALQDNQKTNSQPWYNGSYTIAAKPIKTLESHYTMIQFLIIGVSFFSLQVKRLFAVIDKLKVISFLENTQHNLTFT